MREFDISIVLPTRPWMQTKCVYDRALMSAIVDTWSRAKLRAFICCRLYCCVWSVSDMVAGDGKTIQPELFHGRMQVASSPNWPRQLQEGMGCMEEDSSERSFVRKWQSTNLVGSLV